jgi:hypothetical protein
MGTIDLVKAFNAIYGDYKDINHEKAVSYLMMVEQLQSIDSREVAAIAIATAEAMFKDSSW